MHAHVGAAGGQGPEDVGLGAAVEHGHSGRGGVGAGVDVGLGAGHLGGARAALHAGPGVDAFAQRPLAAAIGGDGALHRAPGAQVANQRAGVDAFEAGYAVPVEVVVQRSGAAPGRGRARQRPNHEARDPDLAALGIFVIDPRVADVRRRHGDDLLGIRRIGQDFLVAGHRGVEDGFADPSGGGTERPTGEAPAVFEDQDPLHRDLRVAPGIARARRGVYQALSDANWRPQARQR